MADGEQIPSGDNQTSSGGPEQTDAVSKKDTVAYETYRKLLSEKKARDEALETYKKELAEYKRKEKEAEEAKLKEEQNWKAIVELREKELNEERTMRIQMQEERLNATKLDTFLQSLGGKVDSKYWGMIDLEKIAINPESGQVDQMSVTQAVEAFRKNYPELIKTGTGPKIPSDAPQGNGSLTYEEWKKLPAKEMRARVKDIVGSI